MLVKIRLNFAIDPSIISYVSYVSYCPCLYSGKYSNCKHIQIARFNAIEIIGNSMDLLEKKRINLLI